MAGIRLKQIYLNEANKLNKETTEIAVIFSVQKYSS